MDNTIALLGDDTGHPSHLELNALIPRLEQELDVRATWVPTDGACDVLEFAGVWLVPGSPYANDAAVYAALTRVRENDIPFLGTCGGLQYAVIEYLRNVLGRQATHAESDGVEDHNAVAALTCSLYGEQREVVAVPGTRFADWIDQSFMGMHYCNYAPTAQAIKTLQQAGVLIGATTKDGHVEVLEFPDHPFYIASLFQPHIGASSGRPIHPLIRKFVASTRRRPR